jgi:4-hydroxyphenylpyruvate dioxygenase
VATGDEPIDALGLTHIDHVAFAQPFDAFDEAVLFLRSVLGLAPQTAFEFAAPYGLQRSRAFRNASATVRLPLSVAVLRHGPWAPAVPAPQHVAFACSDIVATARALRERGVPLLPVPENYYDDVDARTGLDPSVLGALRAGGIMYDRDESGGEFFHLYTEMLGSRLFLEVVQRVGGYDGYGAVNSPIHMAAHHLLRVAAGAPKGGHPRVDAWG